MSSRAFPRGTYLFKEGDKIQSLYLIESGNVGVGAIRGKNFLDFYPVGKGQVLGEQALFGVSQHRTAAIALSEVKVVEIPLEPFLVQFEAVPPTVKVILKALGERLKFFAGEIRSHKIEKDPAPMPAQMIAKTFGCIFHTARHLGEVTNGVVVVDWRNFKAYNSRVFLEDGKRFEQAINMLVKFKMAELKYGKNEIDPKAPEELEFVHFLNLPAVEQFFEFYQHYSNKAGKQDLLKVEENYYNIVEAMLAAVGTSQPDRTGAIRIDYPKLVELLKNEYGIALNKDHFAYMELKGLYVKRASSESGEAYIAFNLQEYRTMYGNWKFLLEIDKWNERGTVDMNEPIAMKKKLAQAGDTKCPSCNGATVDKAKFCSQCGFKLAA